jgi:hypothetical protein
LSSTGPISRGGSEIAVSKSPQGCWHQPAQ